MSLAFESSLSLLCSKRGILHSHADWNQIPTIAAAKLSSSAGVVICSLTTPTDLMRKIKDKLKGKSGNAISLAATGIGAADIPSDLCVVDTLQRLGVDRYFHPEIDGVLNETYKLWQRRQRDIYSDISIHAMAFRLLRVKGYQVSSEELAPYADVERMNLRAIDVSKVVELYRAAQERIDEEERSLKRLHGWTTNFLMHQLQTNSIPDEKLHKLVEHYLKNYHGILDRMGVRRNLDLYDICHALSKPEGCT